MFKWGLVRNPVGKCSTFSSSNNFLPKSSLLSCKTSLSKESIKVTDKTFFFTPALIFACLILFLSFWTQKGNLDAVSGNVNAEKEECLCLFTVQLPHPPDFLSLSIELWSWTVPGSSPKGKFTGKKQWEDKHEEGSIPRRFSKKNEKRMCFWEKKKGERKKVSGNDENFGPDFHSSF